MCTNSRRDTRETDSRRLRPPEGTSTMRNRNRSTLHKYGAAVAVLAALGSTAACGSNDDGSTKASSSTGSGSTKDATGDSGMDASSDLVGPGCADYAKAVPSGKGSVAGMAQDPVA